MKPMLSTAHKTDAASGKQANSGETVLENIVKHSFEAYLKQYAEG